MGARCRTVRADAGATSAPPARKPDIAPTPTARAGIPRQIRRSDANAGGTTGPARLECRRARDQPAYVTPWQIVSDDVLEQMEHVSEQHWVPQRSGSGRR